MLGGGFGLSVSRVLSGARLDGAVRPDLPDVPVVPDVPPFVTAIWGQSEHQHILLEFDDVLAKEELVDQDRVTFWWHDRTTGGAGGVHSVTLNDTTRATATVTAAMVAMGNTFMRQIPDRDIKIIMHTQSGTTPEEIMDDSYVATNLDGAPARRWQDDWALNAAATADGYVVDHPWHSWFAAPGSWGTDYGQNMFAFIKGRDHLTGADLVYSSGSPLVMNGISVSRTLRDLYPHEPSWIATSGAHVSLPTEDLSNAITLSSGGGQASLLNKQTSTESWREVIRNPALATHFSDEVFALNGYANGADDGGVWTDQSHPTGLIDAGINRMARQMAHAIMRGAQVTAFDVPMITHAEWQPDGSYMEFWSDAGAITTYRGGTGGAGNTFDHWTDVVGVEIDGVPAHRAEIQPNGRVRVYPNTGVFTNTSLIQFGRGGASGWVRHDEDAYAGLWDDYPIVDVGLPDLAGVPLATLPDPVMLESTIVGVTSFQTSNAGPQFVDTSNVPANTSALTFRAVLVMDADTASNTPDVLTIGGLQLRLATIVSQGRLRLTIKDNANTTLLNNVGTAMNVFPASVQHEVLMKVDLAAGRALIYLNGEAVPVLDQTFTASDPRWSTSRTIAMLGGVQFKGAVESLQLWLNEASLDNVVPSTVPYKVVSGTAAAVNADPWKTGSDAVA